ncbi:hypothetical protein HDE_12684 [Halotydeus destructor]|nr:hypothetical protein HDE_12684 [Halotydeus destructor]
MDYELNKDMLIIRQNTKQLCSERLGSEFVLVASELALQNPSSSRRVVTQLLSLALRERIISSSDINEALSVIFKSSHTLDPTFWTSLGQVINNVFDDICITGL